MHDEHELAEQIRDHGYRMTPQRELVLDALSSDGGHMSANEIFAALHETAPALNRATVYRTLQFLCDLQLVTRTEIGGQAVYELAAEKTHHHLVCRLCGAVRDLPARHFAPLQQQLMSEYGFQAEINHLAVSGVCAGCRADEGQ